MGTQHGISDEFGAGGVGLAPDGTTPNLRDELRRLKASIHAPVANATAMQAIAAADRADGMLIVKLDDDTVWSFDAGSAATASTSVIVPTAGTGRWLRKTASLTDIGGTAIQSGSVTLVAGTQAAIIPATITASSKIVAFLKTPNTTSLTVKYAALDSDRVVGASGSGGGFKVTALVAAGTINVADVSTLDYIIIG